MLSRRNAIIGLGGLVAGGGVLVGTGAFDTVEAERTVNVETAGDASAFLGLTQAEGAGDEYVDEPDGDTIAIDISGDGTDGAGLNQNARTRFDNLVTITNQATQTIGSIQLGFTEIPNVGSIEGDLGETFKFTVADEATASDFDSNGAVVPHGNEEDDLVEILGAGDVASELPPGEAITFGLEFNLIAGGDANDDLPNGDYTLTIEANTDFESDTDDGENEDEEDEDEGEEFPNNPFLADAQTENGGVFWNNSPEDDFAMSEGNEFDNLPSPGQPIYVNTTDEEISVSVDDDPDSDGFEQTLDIGAYDGTSFAEDGSDAPWVRIPTGLGTPNPNNGDPNHELVSIDQTEDGFEVVWEEVD